MTILFAIESGSRAWGFPSPDSDYDCRFVYLRSLDQHLVLQAQRDVIEFPLEGEIDAGGWDLRKALVLALKGNAVICEWANSRHVYEEVAGFRTRLQHLLAQIASPGLVARHYAGLLKRHSSADSGCANLKKLFYALRPALSLQYMEEREFRELPPMNIGSLLAGIALDDNVRGEIDAMLAVKKATRELGTGPVPRSIAAYLAAVEQRYRPLPKTLGATDRSEVRRRFGLAEEFYKDAVRAYG